MPVLIAILLAAADLATGTDAALAAVRRCAADGQQVSVAIVGAEGEPRVLLRGDGAPPHSLDAARRKAYTAVSFEQPTEALATLIATHPDAAQLTRLDNTLFVSGGLPIVVDGHIVGAVGVSGGKGPKYDERCAQVAIDKLAATRR